LPQTLLPIAYTICVLFLCSYDKSTLRLVESAIDEIRKIYDPYFQRRLLPLLAKDIRIFEERSGKGRYLVLSEKYENEWNVYLFKDKEVINRLRCSYSEYELIMERIENFIKLTSEYKEMMITSKVIELGKWSDLIIVIKDKELGKGGELVELSMIMCPYLFKGDTTLVQKTIILKRGRVRLSWMVKEIIKLAHMRHYTYSNFSSLVDKIKGEIDLVFAIKKIRGRP
jgi:hypothetical protein